jgi:hypothetical protein
MSAAFSIETVLLGSSPARTFSRRFVPKIHHPGGDSEASADMDACSALPGRKGSRCEAGAAPQL